jgi:hypothetical protein
MLCFEVSWVYTKRNVNECVVFVDIKGIQCHNLRNLFAVLEELRIFTLAIFELALNDVIVKKAKFEGITSKGE